MRKTLPIMLALALAVLPGCVFAIGGPSDWDDGHQDSRVAKLEKRVATLEKHTKQMCGESCPYCQH
jgi:hypothetical protein